MVEFSYFGLVIFMLFVLIFFEVGRELYKVVKRGLKLRRVSSDVLDILILEVNDMDKIQKEFIHEVRKGFEDYDLKNGSHDKLIEELFEMVNDLKRRL